MRTQRIIFGVATAAVLAAVVSLRAIAGGAVTVQRIDVTRLPAIDVYCTVTDSSGSSVLGLTGREVAVSIDGKPQATGRVSSALAGGASLAVALLFDRSGSVQAAQSGIRAAALEFASRLGRDDQLAVISFDETVRVDAPLSTDRQAAERAIQAIPPGRNTALYDAIQSAIDLLKASSAKRVAILVLSDGRDTSSRARAADVRAAAKSHGVPIFSLGVGASVDAGVLDTLARETGGDALTVSQPDELRVLYQKIGDRLANQYLISFTSSFGEDGAWHRLGVNVESAGTGPLAVTREFLATRSLGVSREFVASAEQRAAELGWAVLAAIGGLIGAIAGGLIVFAVRIVRPGVSTPAALAVGIVVLAGLCGGIVAVLVSALGT